MSGRGAWLTRRFALTPIKAFAIVTLLVMATAAATWFSVDRSQFLRATCEAGFPNITLLALSDDGKLACAVFGEKQRVLGVVESVGGWLFLYNPSFADEDGEEGRVRFQCLRDGCETALTRQLETTFITPCVEAIGPYGFAGAIVEGWVTEDKFGFGHQPLVGTRVMVIDRVIEVYDPPSSRIAEMRQVFDKVCMED